MRILLGFICAFVVIVVLLLASSQIILPKLVSQYIARQLNADVNIESIIPSPVAGEKAVLTEEQKDLGVVLVDIGAETTSMIVFEEGKILSLVIFPVGSANITNDLAIGLQTETSITEKIKKDYGLRDVSTKKIEIYLPTFLTEEDLDIYKNRRKIEEQVRIIQKEVESESIIMDNGTYFPNIKNDLDT